MLNHTKLKLRQILNVQRDNLLALSFFIVVTVIVSWPILTQLNAVIIGVDNDVFINPWADWWTKKALQSSELTLWKTNFLFFPQGANLIYHSFSHYNTLLSLLLQSIFKPLAAYNLAILSNYVLAGFAMFQLVKYLTGSFSASIVGGLVFAFNSHNLYQSSHPVLVSIWCFPWITLYLMRAVQERQLKWAAVAGVFVFLGTFSSTVLLILILIWVAILFIFLWFSKEWKRPSWSTIIIFGSVSALLTVPLLLPLLYDAFVGGNNSFIIDPLKSITTDFGSLFSPHWTNQFYSFPRGLYLGIVPLILAIYAIIKCRQKTWLWLFLFIFSLSMSLGPNPRLFQTKYEIILPWSYMVAPVIRNTYRFNILTSFGFSVLVALGWQQFYIRIAAKKKLRNILLIVLLILIGADYLLPMMPYTRIKVSNFYTDILQHEPDNIVVATLPNGRQQGKRHLFYQIYHEHPITGGVISRANSYTFDYIFNNAILAAGEKSGEPASLPSDMEQSLTELSNKNIKYLIIDKKMMRNQDPWRTAMPHDPFYEDDFVLVYRTDVDS